MNELMSWEYYVVWCVEQNGIKLVHYNYQNHIPSSDFGYLRLSVYINI